MARNIEDNPLVNFINRLRELGLENTACRRFYAKYPGRVEEIKRDDRGLIRVSVREILDRPFSVWARPDTYAGNGYGLYLPPQVDDPVWVTFANGDPTQPRYSGGWWMAPSNTPNSAVSHVPEEFKNPGQLPSTRGLVVPAGHGWLFEDQVGRDQRFEVWTGFRDPAAPRTPIVKHHQLIMSDEPGNERVSITSFAGHTIRLVDIEGQEHILIESKDKTRRVLINDIPGAQKIEVESDGRKLLLDDVKQLASIETALQKVELNDALPMITIQTPGEVIVTAGGAASVTAAGAVNVTGAGVNINSLAGTANFVGQGAAAMKFTGAMIQEILSLSVISEAIKLGDTAGAVALVTEAFLEFFRNHTHLDSLGAPTSSPVEAVPDNAVLTTKTKAS